MNSIIDRFRELHRRGLFVMPNPWDLGTAKLLEGRGFPALATTSWGLAFSLGRADYQVSRDELVAHTAELTGAVNVPINVDAERLFPDDPGGIARTVQLLADAGAAGCSIEDSDPEARTIARLRLRGRRSRRRYAPGLTDPEEIARVVMEVGTPVNVLSRANGPAVAELAALGVRRVSTGGGLARIAIAAVEEAVEELLDGSPPQIPSG